MLNYINSELFRVKNRMYAKMFILINCICVVGGLFLLHIAAADVGKNMNMNLILQITPAMYAALEFLVLIIVDIVFSEEYKHHTLKNPVAYGINRRDIYLGKVVTEVILSIVTFVIVIAVLLVASYFIVGVDTATIAEDFKVFGIKSLAFLPLGIAAISFANFLAFTINSNNIFSFLYVGLVLGAPKIVSLLGHFYEKLYDLQWILPSTYIHLFQDETIGNEVVAKCYGIGLLYLVVFAVIGIVLFRRREVK